MDALLPRSALSVEITWEGFELISERMDSHSEGTFKPREDMANVPLTAITASIFFAPAFQTHGSRAIVLRAKGQRGKRQETRLEKVSRPYPQGLYTTTVVILQSVKTKSHHETDNIPSRLCRHCKLRRASAAVEAKTSIEEMSTELQNPCPHTHGMASSGTIMW
ncbi:MAG: hypothetical protein LQ345_006511, partial [Seirophora villosa]